MCDVKDVIRIACLRIWSPKFKGQYQTLTKYVEINVTYQETIKQFRISSGHNNYEALYIKGKYERTVVFEKLNLNTQQHILILTKQKKIK